MIKTFLTKVTFVESLGLSVLGMLIVFAMLIALMVVLAIMARSISGKSKKPAQDATETTAAPAVPVAPSTVEPQTMYANNAPAPGSAGEIKLYNVPEKQAAMVMAIVANHLNVPLNQLRFKSIRRVD